MNKTLFINEEAFQSARSRGLRKLRVQLLFLLVFLIVFFGVGFLTIKTIFQEQEVLVQYCAQSGIEVLLWVIAILFLWKETKIGRLLFTLVSIFSLYGLYSIVMFYQYDAKDLYEHTIRILFTILYICKCITFLMYTYRLYQKPIAYVWERYETTGQSAEEEDRALIQKLFAENDDYEVRKQSQQKIKGRALRTLKWNAILLIACIYGGLILIFMGLFLLRLYVSSDGKGIDYVQRYMLFASLYSALIWSLPAIAMFLYKRWTYYTFIVAWILELIRFSTSLSNTIDMFMTQHYGWPSIITICLLEVIRYTVFARFTISFIKDPFIQAYWKNKNK
ncbi:MAG: hypothetical protein RR531_06330 [Longicatena sp.]